MQDMKGVVILSGGMDSAVLLALLRQQNVPEILTLTFNYGSKHGEQECEAAQRVSTFYHAPNRIVSLPFIAELFVSDLLQTGGEIPEGHYWDDSMKRTVVPFRNSIMLTIAAGYAESVGAHFVAIGNHAGGPTPIYLDARVEYIEAMRAVFKLGGSQNIQLESPFATKTKRDIGLLGASLGVPFELTYSCYKGGQRHCGKCGACVHRKEALAGFDPTQYEE